MNKTHAGIVIASILLSMTFISPAYAQSNTEILRDIAEDTNYIVDNMEQLIQTVRVALADVSQALSQLEGITTLVGDLRGDITAMTDEVKKINELNEKADESVEATSKLLEQVETNGASLTEIKNTLLGDTCGDGTTVINGLCVADIVECQSNLVKDGTCLRDVECGYGTVRSENFCIADFSISFCGPGTTFVNGQCVVGGGAVPPNPVTPIIPPITDPSTPLPPDTTPTPPLTTPDPVCPTGYSLVNGQCVLDAPAATIAGVNGIAVTLSDNTSYKLALLKDPTPVQQNIVTATLSAWCPVGSTPSINVDNILTSAEIVCTDANGVNRTVNDELLKVFGDMFDNSQCNISKFKDATWSKCVTAPPAPIIMVKDDVKTSIDISNYDYKQYGEKRTSGGLTYYGLDLTFQCTESVTLETAQITKANAAHEYLVRDANDRDGNGTPAETDTTTRTTNGLNFIEVDGYTLYHNDYQINSNSYLELLQTRDFEDRLLSTSLSFETQIHEGEFIDNTTNGFVIGKFVTSARYTSATDADKGEFISTAVMDNSTHDNEIELYTLDVVWDTTQGATCNLVVDGDNTGTPGQGVNTQYTKLFAANIQGTGLIRNFESVLNCHNNPYTITSIRANGELMLTNSGHNKMGLTILDGTNDGSADVKYLIGAAPSAGSDFVMTYDTTTAKKLPLDVTGHNLKISGDVVANDQSNLLIDITYNSVPNIDCTVTNT